MRGQIFTPKSDVRLLVLFRMVAFIGCKKNCGSGHWGTDHRDLVFCGRNDRMSGVLQKLSSDEELDELVELQSF
jgi:hypothetical protein